MYNYDVIICVCEDFPMQNGIILRIAQQNDAPSVAKIEAECFSDAWSEKSLAEQIDGKMHLTVVAECDGEVVGYVSGQLIPPECEVFRVATLSAFRRKGIAEAMLTYFENTADGVAKNTFFIEVREANTAARSLYRKSGYEEIAVRKNYYKNPCENAIILKKAPRDIC